jgi:putative ABC transport system permease protein
MAMKQHLREARRSLLGNKKRTILALIGIVIGIGSVIALVTVGRIVEEQSLRQFLSMGTNLFQVQGSTTSQGQGWPLAKAMALPDTASDVGLIAPFTTTSGSYSYGMGNWQDEQLYGVTAGFLGASKIKLAQGRNLTPMDKGSYFCVIGQELAKRMRKQGAGKIIGSRLIINGLIFPVVGVMEHVESNMMRPWGLNKGALIPITTALRIPGRQMIHTAIVRIAPGGTQARAQAQSISYFKRLAPEITVRIESPQQLIHQMEKQMRLFTLLLGAIGAISLVVGGVGVMNVMLVSVSERKREIGIRRALGAQRKDIQWQFLTESIILCLIGGFIGAVIGVGVSYFIALFSHWVFVASYSAVVVGVGVSLLIGVFFGYYPARQASMLSPIEALRD